MQSGRAPWTLRRWQTSLNPIAFAAISPNGRISPPALRNFSTTLPAVAGAIANLRRYARPCCEDAHSCCAPTSLVGASLACTRRPCGHKSRNRAALGGPQLITSPAGGCTGSSSPSVGVFDHLNSKWRPGKLSRIGSLSPVDVNELLRIREAPLRMRPRGEGGHSFAATTGYQAAVLRRLI